MNVMLSTHVSKLKSLIDTELFFVIGMKCTGYPGPGLDHTSPRVLFNPMSEYINRHGEEHLEASFEQFKKTHGHQYETELEHRQRLNIFRNNVRYVNTRNRASLPYKMKINKFADRTVCCCFFRQTSYFDSFLFIRMMNYVYSVVDDIPKVIMVVFLFHKN